VARRRLENPVVVPGVLSYLAYGSFGSRVVGLNQIPQDQWPDNIELLYYSYHIMVGLGTLHILVMLGAALQLLRGRLTSSRKALWALVIAFPFPIIATTAGWFTAELGRQPWIVWGIMRTAKGPSPTVSAGNTIFTYLGFSGLYLVIGILFLWLVGREIARGPAPVPESSADAAAAPPA
jgi:cytochrome d ubiquinol oxidase subunit I